MSSETAKAFSANVQGWIKKLLHLRVHLIKGTASNEEREIYNKIKEEVPKIREMIKKTALPSSV